MEGLLDGRAVGLGDGAWVGNEVGKLEPFAVGAGLIVGSAVGGIHSSENGSHRRCRLLTKTKTPLHCESLLSTMFPQAVLLTALTFMLKRLLTAGPKRAARLLMSTFRCIDVEDPASIYIAPPFGEEFKVSIQHCTCLDTLMLGKLTEFRATFSLKVAS